MLPARLSRSLLLLLVFVPGVWLILQPAVLPSNTNTADIIRPPISADIVRGEAVVPILAVLQANQTLGSNQNSAYRPFNNAESDSVGELNIVSSFKAIDYTQSQQGVPPNPAIMVGSQQVVVSVNSSFQVFDKSGTSLVGPTLFKDFWGSGCGTGSSTMVLSFPFSAYDEQFGRYVLGVAGYDSAVNGGDNGYLCLAVSQTDNAIGQWYLYSFDGNPETGAELRLEFPRFGTGQTALFLGATMFGSFNFVTNRIFAFDKAAMYSGNTAALVTADVGDPYFHIVPADLKGYHSGNWPTDPNEAHYFVEAETGFGNEIRVFAFDDPWGTATFTLVGTVTVSNYGLTFDQPQAGTSLRINSLDNRLMNVVYSSGRLWAAHTIGCNPGGGSVNCLRWYEIEVTDSSQPQLLQEGTYSSSGSYRSFPALSINGCGDSLVGYTKTSSSLFPGAYVAGREAADTPGQLKSETTLHAGEVFYTAEDGEPFRWGYYSSTTLDPDGRTFWHIGPYSRLQPVNRWSTWIGAFTWSGCQPPPTLTPSPSPTTTPTASPTNTPTPTPSVTPTASPSPTATSTGTPTMTPIATATSTPSLTPTTSPSPSVTSTDTPTLTATLTSTFTPTQTPSLTATPTETPPAKSYRNWLPIVMR